ncbi:MAG: glycosyltransferase family 2 protein [Candidatus Levybacteria bacterium]|nr:glycosyltransferase family 2 protein [Candidatus Levybacteria bacterium]
MKNKLSVLTITKNVANVLEKSLRSVEELADEIIIIDNYSKDQTVNIAKKYFAKIYLNREEDFGKQKAFGLYKAVNEWILVLDSDEIVSKELSKEIKKLLSQKIVSNDGFYIKYQNHFLGKKIFFGGESYQKLRLFRKSEAIIKPALVHEEFFLKSHNIGSLKHKIFHYSYRSIPQIYKKFTVYAIKEAQKKIAKGDKTNFEKILLYPAHMFWCRYVKEKGYRDGILRILLDLGFTYMEFLSYFLMIFIRKYKYENIKDKPK